MTIAAIRIRGEVRKTPDITATLTTLKLNHKNNCILLEDNPSSQGMLRKASGYITWGTISEDLVKELIEKRGKTPDQKHFKLSPPRGGFDQGGIRKYYKMRGACGNRKEKISDLLRRMI